MTVKGGGLVEIIAAYLPLVIVAGIAIVTLLVWGFAQ